MTIHVSYSMNCDECGKCLLHNGYAVSEDCQESVVEYANEQGWWPQVTVPNGSKWDFCPVCYKKYLERLEED